jgi:hypothetical protein
LPASVLDFNDNSKSNPGMCIITGITITCNKIVDYRTFLSRWMESVKIYD